MWRDPTITLTGHVLDGDPEWNSSDYEWSRRHPMPQLSGCWRNVDHPAGLDRCRRVENRIGQRCQVFNLAGSRADENNRHPASSGTLLVRYPLIDSQQDIVSGSLRGSEQVSILCCLSFQPTLPCARRAGESCAGNRAAVTHPKGSSRDLCEQRIFRFFQRTDGQLVRDGRELPQKLTEGMPALKNPGALPIAAARRSVSKAGCGAPCAE